MGGKKNRGKKFFFSVLPERNKKGGKKGTSKKGGPVMLLHREGKRKGEKQSQMGGQPNPWSRAE